MTFKGGPCRRLLARFGIPESKHLALILTLIGEEEQSCSQGARAKEAGTTLLDTVFTSLSCFCSGDDILGGSDDRYHRVQQRPDPV